MALCVFPGQALVYDAEPAYDAFFTKTLAQNYANPGLAFDVVLFLRDNLENLCYNTHILSRFFPNLFKVSFTIAGGYLISRWRLPQHFANPAVTFEVFSDNLWHLCYDTDTLSMFFLIIQRFKVCHSRV